MKISQYTITLRNLMKTNYKEKIESILDGYPLFEESHRNELNHKIIDHYYLREIDSETPEEFCLFLRRKLNEIMPYYNQLYKSESIDFNPLFNIDITESFERQTNDIGDVNNTSNQKTKDISKSHSNSLNCNNDTPNQEMTKQDLESNKFMSSFEHNTDEGQNENSSLTENKANVKTINQGSERWTRKQQGSSAGLPFSKAIQQWRDVMLNIDMQIIEELECLFIQLW